jgi:hypothetical protein
MPLKSILFALLAASTLSSCAVNQGNSAIKDFGRFSDLQKGKSTKKDVYQGFGQPHDVRYEGPSSQWTYYSIQSTMSPAAFIPFVGLVAGGLNNDITTADFFFDSKDTLLRYSTGQRAKFVNSFVGVAQGAASFSSAKQSDRVQAEMTKYGNPFDKKEASKAKDMGTVLGSKPRG